MPWFGAPHQSKRQAQPCNGRPQLMRYIGNQPLLRFHQSFHSRGHTVEITSQAANLVPSIEYAGLGDARFEVTPGKPGGERTKMDYGRADVPRQKIAEQPSTHDKR